MMRWLWRDHPVSTDPNDKEERSFLAPPVSPPPQKRSGPTDHPL